MFAKYLYMQVLIEFSSFASPLTKHIFSLHGSTSINFLIIFQNNGRNKEKKLSQLWLFIHHERRSWKAFDGGGKKQKKFHDEDQVENVISNVACNSLIYFSHTTTRFFRQEPKREKN